jgi:hypothetical protein
MTGYISKKMLGVHDKAALRGAIGAPIKMEGGIADPDEFRWECNCEACREKYRSWKAEYEAQQKELREPNAQE